MTFVNKSPKWVIPPLQDTPGPGSYTITPQKQQLVPSPSFLSKTLREEEKVQSMVEVGPGSYNLAKPYNKENHSQAAFMSKIQRFDTRKEENEDLVKTEMEQKFQQLIKYGERQKCVPGKIISFNQRREFEKKLMPQILPSIPTQQCSFGYRYDQITKKLVQNQNPKIIFANVLSSTNQDFFFQRTQSYIGKGLHYSIQKNLKRPSPELAYQIGLPDPTKYQPELNHHSSTSSVKKTNAFASTKERFEESPSPKQLLKLQKLKREFKDFIPSDLQLKELQQVKTKASIYDNQSTIRKGKNTECFLSKINRFKQRKTVEKQGQKQKLLLKIAEKPAQKENVGTQKPKTKKKQPYDLGEVRFKQKGKQNLGPGYYEAKVEEHNAANLSLKQERFKTQNITHDIPGPGAYEIEPLKVKQKTKVPFNRYVCNNDKEKNRFSSMQSLYEQIGKQLNYQNKADRQNLAKARCTPQKHTKAYEVYKRDLSRMKELVKS